MLYLREQHANRIIQRMSRIVPHNINILDRTGVIIASCNSEFIGEIRASALRAINSEEASIVYKESRHEPEGISFPIWFSGNIVGILEINGDVDKIMQIGQMCVTLTELILENIAYNTLESTNESRRLDFFFDWTSRPINKYDEQFINQARIFNVDLKIQRAIVIIHFRRNRYSLIDLVKNKLLEGEYIVRQTLSGIILVLRADYNLHQHLQEIMKISSDFIHAFVGRSTKDMADSLQVAGVLERLGPKIFKDRQIFFYEELSLEYILASTPPCPELENLYKVLSESDLSQSLETSIIACVHNNCNHTEICERLFIHRNTLNYRLDKIQQITGKDPRSPRDLILLYTSIILDKIQSINAIETISVD